MANLSKMYKHEFSIWSNMKDRCNNPNFKQYSDYGGRGICVCNEWNKFSSFLQWINNSNFEIGLQIDRIDNDGNYEPSNCHFVSARENTAIGKRRIYSSNKSGYNGISYDKANNKWLVQIRINNFNKKLGRYVSIDEALAARTAAEILLFGKQMTNL